MTDTSLITMWHKAARPNPTEADLNVQIGCHLEEVAEMLDSLEGMDMVTENKLIMTKYLVSVLAEYLKEGSYSVRIKDRRDFLDACCDQVVTAIGAAYCAGMDINGGMDEVSRSNWSKMVDGEFVRDENGKIKKPSSYSPPDLGEFV